MRDGYYYGTQAVQFSFFMVPKILLSAPPFRGLSMEAKMLYCTLALWLTIHSFRIWKHPR